MADNDRIKLDNRDLDCFALRPVVFETKGCWKSEMHRITPEVTEALKCQKYPVYTEYSPTRSEFHPVSFQDQSFSIYKVVENHKCTVGMTPEWALNYQKYPVYTKYSISLYHQLFSRYKDWKFTPEAQISPNFALRSLVFQITFWFPHRV